MFFCMNVNYIDKAEILVEAMPYIGKFQNKTFVIKYGGSLIDDYAKNKSIIQDICFLKTVGINVIVVHGGGKEINKTLSLYGIEPKFIYGVRYTDDKTLEIAEKVLSGKINKQIVFEIQQHNINAVGISGKDGFLAKATQKSKNLGKVGKITNIKTDILQTLLKNNYIPVISPICYGENGESFNVNADEMAVEIAKAICAEKLIFLSNIDGIFKDINDKNSLMSKIKISEIDDLIKKQYIKDGMIPKIKSCQDAVKSGINSVHIINGEIKHSLLLEIYTDKGIGSLIEK